MAWPYFLCVVGAIAIVPLFERKTNREEKITIFGLGNCALCPGMHIRPCHVANIIPGNWDCIPEPILQKRIHKFFANQQK